MTHHGWNAAPVEVPEGMPVPILQDMREWGLFYEWVKGLGVVSVVEIGAFFGGTLWHWAQLPTVRRIVSVDLPISTGDGRYSQMVECRAQWRSWMSAIDFNDIQTRSDDPATLDRVERLGPYDLAFIDGDHSAPAVRADWENYSRMVRPGGVVVFHDTVGLQGVRELVVQLKRDHAAVEFTNGDELGLTAVFV